MSPSQRKKIVNVASVPQRSPFRFPGGKTWLIPRVRVWLSSGDKPSVLVEPFAGGGIVSLTAAAEGLVGRAVMVELDKEVCAVWQTIVNGDAHALGQRILTFDLTKKNVRKVLSQKPMSTSGLAFQTIIRNRVNRGGILAPGVGMIKAGENNKGISSRWYPETLNKRILDIATYRKRLTVTCGDGLKVIEKYVDDTSAAFFIDPPYTAGTGKKAGSRLYTYSDLDHDRLFELAASVQGSLLMTYDNDKDVRQLARRHGLKTKAIPMKTTHHAETTELLIGKDLSWAKKT